MLKSYSNPHLVKHVHCSPICRCFTDKEYETFFFKRGLQVHCIVHCAPTHSHSTRLRYHLHIITGLQAQLGNYKLYVMQYSEVRGIVASTLISSISSLNYQADALNELRGRGCHIFIINLLIGSYEVCCINYKAAIKSDKHKDSHQAIRFKPFQS